MDKVHSSVFPSELLLTLTSVHGDSRVASSEGPPRRGASCASQHRSRTGCRWVPTPRVTAQTLGKGRRSDLHEQWLLQAASASSTVPEGAAGGVRCPRRSGSALPGSTAIHY